MVDYAADITRINNRKTTDSYVLNEGGVWSKAQEQLGIQLKEEESKGQITVSQNTFETMQTNGEVEERDGKFYIKGSETLINVTEGTTAPVEEKKKEDTNVGFRERLKNLFVKPETKSSVDNNTNVIPASFTNTSAGEGGSQIPTEAGEDMNRQGGGVLKNNLKLMTDRFDKFNIPILLSSSFSVHVESLNLYKTIPFSFDPTV